MLYYAMICYAMVYYIILYYTYTILYILVVADVIELRIVADYVEIWFISCDRTSSVRIYPNY